jgi:hypothetical protein
MFMQHPSMTTPLVRAGLRRFHENISIHALPRLMAERSAVRTVSAFIEHGLPVTHVSWGNRACFNLEVEPVTFSELEKIVNDNQVKYYQQNISH